MNPSRPIIQDALNLIEDPVRWTAGTNARDGNGRAIDPNDPGACQWCAVGALVRASIRREFPYRLRTLEDLIDAKVGELYPFKSNYVQVNDELGHAAIVRVLQEVIKDLTD